MKRTLLAAAVSSAAMIGAASAGELSVDTGVAFETRYVFRGVQYAEESIQPSVQLNYGNFYVGTWYSLPLGDANANYSDELDFYAGYGFALSEMVSLDVGATIYTFPDALTGVFDFLEENAGTGSATFEAYAGLSFDLPLSPSVYIYRDFSFDTVTVQGSAGYSFPLSEAMSFDVGGTLGYVMDDDAGGDYIYGGVTADVSYAVSEGGAISVGVRYGGSDLAGGSLWDVDNGTTKSSGVWFGTSVSASF